jgi:hypothetical protein
MMMATCFGSFSNSSDVLGAFFRARLSAVFHFMCFSFPPRLPSGVGFRPASTGVFYHIFSVFASGTFRRGRGFLTGVFPVLSVEIRKNVCYNTAKRSFIITGRWSDICRKNCSTKVM